MTPQALAAVILAGGSGNRLGGVSKASLKVGGETLLHRVVRGLDSATIVLLAGGARASLPLPEGVVPVVDVQRDAGPVAGLAAAVSALAISGIADGLLISVAVDTPFFPPIFAARAAAALGARSGVAVATYRGQSYPTNAVWRLSQLQELPARLAVGTAPRALKALAAELGTVVVDWSAAEHDPFANVNTITDLLTLQRRARKSGGAKLSSHPVNEGDDGHFRLGKQDQTR